MSVYTWFVSSADLDGMVMFVRRLVVSVFDRRVQLLTFCSSLARLP